MLASIECCATEEWRPIPGFEGFYEISSFGRLKRIKATNGTAAGTIRKYYPNHKGYLCVKLERDGVPSHHTAHGLVCSAFIGPRPTGATINHKDGDKSHNHPDNLEYITNYGNFLHAIGSGLRTKRIPKITISEARKILDLKGHLSAAVVGNHYELSERSVRCIWERKSWKHL